MKIILDVWEGDPSDDQWADELGRVEEMVRQGYIAGQIYNSDYSGAWRFEQ